MWFMKLPSRQPVLAFIQREIAESVVGLPDGNPLTLLEKPGTRTVAGFPGENERDFRFQGALSP
jgi:hypothetical protein